MVARTEGIRKEFCDLERLETGALMTALLEGQIAALDAARAAAPALENAVTAAVARLSKPHSRLIYVGAGTSGRLALLDGVELAPTFDWPQERMAFLLAGGSTSLSEAQEGAEDDEDAARSEIVGCACGADDVVVALAASGTTPYTLAAVELARERGALTIGIANNAGSPLLEKSEVPILLDTGAEVLSGSTRMAAGTSQKIALNAFSTAVMVRLGRVYQGQMVDMRVTNKKLRRRAEAMLSAISGADATASQQALEATQYRVKPALLVLKGMSADEAQTALKEHGDDLHRVLSTLETPR